MLFNENEPEFFLVLRKNFLLNKQWYGPSGIIWEQLGKLCYFGNLSPGVQPFPKTSLIIQNNEYVQAIWKMNIDAHADVGSTSIEVCIQGKLVGK